MNLKDEEINSLKKENEDLKNKLIEKVKTINIYDKKLINMQQKINQQLDEERKIKIKKIIKKKKI